MPFQQEDVYAGTVAQTNWQARQDTNAFQRHYFTFSSCVRKECYFYVDGVTVGTNQVVTEKDRVYKANCLVSDPMFIRYTCPFSSSWVAFLFVSREKNLTVIDHDLCDSCTISDHGFLTVFFSTTFEKSFPCFGNFLTNGRFFFSNTVNPFFFVFNLTKYIYD